MLNCGETCCRTIYYEHILLYIHEINKNLFVYSDILLYPFHKRMYVSIISIHGIYILTLKQHYVSCLYFINGAHLPSLQIIYIIIPFWNYVAGWLKHKDTAHWIFIWYCLKTINTPNAYLNIYKDRPTHTT